MRGRATATTGAVRFGHVRALWPGCWQTLQTGPDPFGAALLGLGAARVGTGARRLVADFATSLEVEKPATLDDERGFVGAARFTAETVGLRFLRRFAIGGGLWR